MVENLTTTMSTEGAVTENQVNILSIMLEKLDGGYISDISGKRAIHLSATDIIDKINLERRINRLDNDTYHFTISIIPQDMIDNIEGLAMLGDDHQIMSVQDAKDAGIIEVEKFNPHKEENVIEEPIIKVDSTNCYSGTRLKAIDWKGYSEQLDLPIIELANIAGLKKDTFYNTWANIMKGTYKYQRTDVKIGLTVLAKYFEKTLDVRTSTKEQCEKMKEDLLKMIRDIELMGNKKSYIKTSDVSKKLIDMRKILM